MLLKKDMMRALIGCAGLLLISCWLGGCAPDNVRPAEVIPPPKPVVPPFLRTPPPIPSWLQSVNET